MKTQKVTGSNAEVHENISKMLEERREKKMDPEALKEVWGKAKPAQSGAETAVDEPDEETEEEFLDDGTEPETVDSVDEHSTEGTGEIVPIEETPPDAGDEESEIDRSLVKAALGEVNGRAWYAVEKTKLEIGLYLCKEFYGDDPERVLKEKPVKGKSLQALKKQKELQVDDRAMASWIRGAALCRVLEDKGFPAENSHLTVSHYIELGRSCKTEAELLKWAHKIDRDALSVRDFKKEIQKLSVDQSLEAKTKAAIKKISDPFALLEDDKAKELIQDKQMLRSVLSTGDKVEVLRTITSTRAKMQESAKLLIALRKDLREMAMEEADEEDASV